MNLTPLNDVLEKKVFHLFFIVSNAPSPNEKPLLRPHIEYHQFVQFLR